MIGRGTLVGVVNNAAGALLGFASLNFITAYAGRDAVGTWAFAFALLGMLSVLGGLGFNQAHIRRLSGGHQEAEALATFLLVKVVLTGLFALLSLAGYFFVTRVVGREPQDITFTVVLLAIVFYAVLNVRGFFDFSFQGRRLFAVGESVLFVDTVVTAFGTMLAAIVAGRRYGRDVPFESIADWTIRAFDLGPGPISGSDAAVYLAVGYIAGKAVSLLYAVFQFARHRFRLGAPTAAMYASYRKYAMPLALVSVLYLLYVKVDTVFLGFFWTKFHVADFEVASRLISPTLIISVALGNVVFPTASHHLRHQDVESIRRVFPDLERFLSMVLFPQVMLILVFANEAIDVTTSGTGYAGAVPILMLLTPFLFFTSLQAPSRSALLGFERPGWLARLGFLQLAILFGLNLIVIPPSVLGVPLLGWAGPGAAGVASLSAVASYLFLRHAAREWAPREPLPPGFFRQAAAALLSGVLLWLLNRALGPGTIDRFLELVGVGLLGLLLYTAFLVLLRELRREDVEMLWETFHPPRFAKYVGGELRGREPK